MIRSVSSVVTLGALALFCTGCPDRKADATADPTAEKEKAEKEEDADKEEAADKEEGDEGEEKGDAEKKDEGGW
jgi:hypothetical protein